MSNKNLLNEAQIRQMMKLAKLEPLTPGFVHGLTESDDELEETVNEEEELEETHGRGVPPGDPGYGVDNTSPGRRRKVAEADELEAELGATEDELGAEDDVADEEEGEIEDLEGADIDDAGGDKMISVSDLLAALEAAIEDVTGEEVETSMDADLEPEEADVDVEDDFAPEGDDVVADEELELQEGDDEEVTTEATDDLVEQITKRVAARILKSALSKK